VLAKKVAKYTSCTWQLNGLVFGVVVWPTRDRLAWQGGAQQFDCLTVSYSDLR
jgi:hypothetical protein